MGIVNLVRELERLHNESDWGLIIEKVVNARDEGIINSDEALELATEYIVRKI